MLTGPVVEEYCHEREASLRFQPRGHARQSMTAASTTINQSKQQVSERRLQHRFAATRVKFRRQQSIGRHTLRFYCPARAKASPLRLMHDVYSTCGFASHAGTGCLHTLLSLTVPRFSNRKAWHPPGGWVLVWHGLIAPDHPAPAREGQSAPVRAGKRHTLPFEGRWSGRGCIRMVAPRTGLLAFRAQRQEKPMSKVLMSCWRCWRLEKIEEGLFRGQSQIRVCDPCLADRVMGQALSAAKQTVASDRQVHSFHSHFLRPGMPASSIVYDVENIPRQARPFPPAGSRPSRMASPSSTSTPPSRWRPRVSSTRRRCRAASRPRAAQGELSWCVLRADDPGGPCGTRSCARSPSKFAP